MGVSDKAKALPVSTEVKVKKAVSMSALYKRKFELLDFTGEWLNSFGKPEKHKPWFLMAPVHSGKSTFVAKLAKYLLNFGRVAYNSIEEGESASIREAFKRAGINRSDKLILLDKEELPELITRLKKHKSPDFIIIDTIQHMDITMPQYKELKNRFPKKTFVIISHMEGNLPSGRLAKFCYEDASIKIRIEGYKAYMSSRMGGGEPFVIWEKGAADYLNGKIKANGKK